MRAFDAYKNLNKRIEDFQIVLPLLQELAKPSVMVRHWDELRQLVKNDFDQESADFTLEFIISLKLENVADEVLEITDGADKQLKIEQDIKEINGIWEVREFTFKDWKSRCARGVPSCGVTPSTRVHRTMPGVVSFLLKRPFGPYSREMLRAGPSPRSRARAS